MLVGRGKLHSIGNWFHYIYSAKQMRFGELETINLLL